MALKSYIDLFAHLQRVCIDVNKELDEKNEENPVLYEVFQFSDIRNEVGIVEKLAKFYNDNYTSNLDYIHIPDLDQMLAKCQNFPVLIARKKGTSDIMGVSTVTYTKNDEQEIDPYSPIENEEFLSITGILAGKNNEVRGVGKKIYSIGILGAIDFCAENSNVKLNCVIDCRNKESVDALKRGLIETTSHLKSRGKLEDDEEITAWVDAVYEVRDPENSDKLLEAPTLVIDIDTVPHKIDEEEELHTFSFTKNDNVELFMNLAMQLREHTEKVGIEDPVINEDKGCGDVYYYPLQNYINLLKVEIMEHDTADGNNRIPVPDELIDSFCGPMPSNSYDDLKKRAKKQEDDLSI